jgi:hypothetical protein
MVWQWGQFLDHDISLTPEHEPYEDYSIVLPIGDEMFDPEGSGTVTIPMGSSIYDETTGTDRSNPRQQMNMITSWIDGSAVYGSNKDRSLWLRSGVGGKLKVSEGNLLPFNDGSQDNAGGFSTNLFIAGDVRANEQIGLTAMHTLFMREHNRLCDEIKAENPEWTDEEIYQRARKIVGAIIQAITFNEFLPALLGEASFPEYNGYNPELDASISNEFSTALYRFGHSMLTSLILRLDSDGNEIPEGHLALRDAFFSPDRVLHEGGIEPILRGLATQYMEEVDTRLVDEVRNFLFGPPGSGGFDLASLNIQRGRDHGLPDYNTLRIAFGLEPVQSFSEITSNDELARALEDIYGSVSVLDPWIGSLAENHLPGSSVGELIRTGLVDQFIRLRDGDRFFYINSEVLSNEDIAMIESSTLAEVIRRNTGISDIQDNVFFVE